MIIVKLQQKYTMSEIEKLNKERIGVYGLHPLCARCLWECKVANVLINFYCADFEEK